MITVKHLSKKYGDFLAVDDLSFTIEDGHIYGFLGPNGAGKSTTLNIMTGCLSATAGEVMIDDYDIYENGKEAKKLIGYLPEIPPLYVDQTPREYLQFVAEAKGIDKKEIPTEIEKVIGETHIETMADRLIKHLSKGYRQRVGIAQALLGNPQVIILDEPTVGLDPMQIIEIRDLIEELGKKHTVILSSHILSEVQAICEKVLIIYKGKLVAFDNPENLSKTLAGGNTIELTVEALQEEILKITDSIPEISKVELKGEAKNSKAAKSQPDENENAMDTCDLIISINDAEPKDVCRKLFFAFANAKKPILEMKQVRTTLEDIFIELTSGDGQTVMQDARTEDTQDVHVEDLQATDVNLPEQSSDKIGQEDPSSTAEKEV